MQIPRIIGILVVMCSPAIMLGGLVMHVTHSWAAVWVFEVIYAIVAITVAFKAAGKPDPHAAEHH
jgi:hypothetical protein